MGILDKVMQIEKTKQSDRQKRYQVVFTKDSAEITEFYIPNFIEKDIRGCTKYVFYKNKGWSKRHLLYFPTDLIRRTISSESFFKVSVQTR